mgnify:CR=1 FL=1
MDDTEILERTYVNMKQIDKFFGEGGYQTLIDISIKSTPSERKRVETILTYVDMSDATIEFFTNRKEWKRCYDESVKLVKFLRDNVDNGYNPV